MHYFFIFAVIVVLVITAAVLINNLIIKKRPSDRKKGVFRLILAIIISIVAGGIGFFMSFGIGEGLMEVLSDKIAMLVTIISVSVFNFVICMFTGKFYPKSIWFSWFLINPIVWSVIIMNPREPGGFIDLWWGWTSLVIFAFIGSVVGSIVLTKKAKISNAA